MRQQQTARRLGVPRSFVYLPHAPAARRLWEKTRATIENGNRFIGPGGPHKSLSDWFFECVVKCLGVLLHSSGLFRIGFDNARDIKLKRIELTFGNLPEAFDGYRVLHITDPHLDMFEGLGEGIARAVREADADICVMTGDYRAGHDGPYKQIIPDMKRILSAIEAPDGTFATLGNHDDHRMGRAFEELGIRLLANETVRVFRGNETFTITGIDDVHRFYTPAAGEALKDGGGDGFSMALVHSPEMAGEAAEAGHDLYLCGHTHGGQICLPGGKPVVTHLTRHHGYARGFWRCGEMIGYTSPGAGCSGLPVRFFCRGEVTLFTLRKAGAGWSD